MLYLGWEALLPSRHRSCGYLDQLNDRDLVAFPCSVITKGALSGLGVKWAPSLPKIAERYRVRFFWKATRCARMEKRTQRTVPRIIACERVWERSVDMGKIISYICRQGYKYWRFYVIVVTAPRIMLMIKWREEHVIIEHHKDDFVAS